MWEFAEIYSFMGNNCNPNPEIPALILEVRGDPLDHHCKFTDSVLQAKNADVFSLKNK